MILIQASGAILLILGSFLVLRAFALADLPAETGPTLEPQLRLVKPQPKAVREPEPLADEDWPQAA